MEHEKYDDENEEFEEDDFAGGQPETKKTNIDFLRRSNDGKLIYLEFIRASVDKTKVITDQKLEYAFKLFDKNGDGYINAAEIKAVLGRDNLINDEETWNNIVKEVDTNGDGTISLEEFKGLRMKFISAS